MSHKNAFKTLKIWKFSIFSVIFSIFSIIILTTIIKPPIECQQSTLGKLLQLINRLKSSTALPTTVSTVAPFKSTRDLLMALIVRLNLTSKVSIPPQWLTPTTELPTTTTTEEVEIIPEKWAKFGVLKTEFNEFRWLLAALCSSLAFKSSMIRS